MVKFEGKNLGEKVEDKSLGKILVQKYWLQKMNTSFVHQVLWLKFCAEKVEDKIWGKILVQKYWLQKMNKSFVHQSKAQVLWLVQQPKTCVHKFWVVVERYLRSSI